jgi:hypothetical protein
MDKMQLVRLDTILSIAPDILEIADLKMGESAKRKTSDTPWIVVE